MKWRRIPAKNFGSITLTRIPTIYSQQVRQNPSTPVAAFGAFFCLASNFGCVPAWLATHQKTWRSLVAESCTPYLEDGLLKTKKTWTFPQKPCHHRDDAILPVCHTFARKFHDDSTKKQPRTGRGGDMIFWEAQKLEEKPSAKHYPRCSMYGIFR